MFFTEFLLCKCSSVILADFIVCHYLDPSTRGWIVTAIGKLASQIGPLDDGTRNMLEKHVTGTDVELRQVSNRGVRIYQLMPCYVSCLAHYQNNQGGPLSCAIFFPSVVQKFKNFLKTPS